MDQPNKITKIRLGSILLDCTTTEEVSKGADVTNRPIEKGEDIADHMKTKPYTVRLSGIMVTDADSKITSLEQLQSDAELLEYVGKRKLKDMVITSFSTKQNKQVYNGYDWDLSLQSVKIAKPQSIKDKVENPETKEPDKKIDTVVKEKTNAGRKQVQNTANRLGQSGTLYSTNISGNTKAMSVTNPVQVRNKMLSTLTQGTENRAKGIGGR